ncbi:E3 SUMO-protein ligase ZBED1 [Labeo rohita]|uniref:E3 SUMO-protein ligase ZBED1 n=1 Tax=Labeo rohita TaxID=84645 RepID=A0ABQ8L2J6_LABRO|nr:E3 SUMO-protein ligase ZBED1 [Labeo rohita]
MSGAFFSHIKYKPDSQEQRIKEEAIAKWVAQTAHPPRTVEDEEFINMMEKIDKRLTVPKKTKITNLVDQMYLAEKVKFKNRLAMARKVTIGIDIWTKKGLTASFLAVSACYFNVQDSKAEHILLNLKQMVHPHTANSIVTLVEECTEEWGIRKEKIIMIITDNGSNMVSAFRVEEEDTSSDENDSNKDSDEEEEADERYGTLERTPCVVHTLQLVVNMVKKEQAIKRLLDKVRHLVRQFSKSSVATERLLEQCGLILIKDCETRWSSSFLMLSRLLEVKDHVTSVADTMGWDCLLPSEWQKVAILKDLLLPFAEHTKVLESDTCCFSLVVPAILDLRSHLSDFSLAHARSYRDVATLAQKMSANMDLRFSCFLDVSASNFSPLAAAACFVDASVSAETLIDSDNDDIQNLLSKAGEYITRSVPYQEEVTDDEDIRNAEVSEVPLQKRPRFRFFSAHRPSSKPKTSKASIRQEVQKFKESLSHANPEESGVDFWSSQSSTMYPLLKPLALDLLAIPASEAFAERVFSLTGDLSSGRRNRARITLERSAFLKLNKV